jgi:hypothetical protein
MPVIQHDNKSSQEYSYLLNCKRKAETTISRVARPETTS